MILIDYTLYLNFIYKLWLVCVYNRDSLRLNLLNALPVDSVFLALYGSNNVDKYKSWVYNCLSEYYVDEINKIILKKKSFKLTSLFMEPRQLFIIQRRPNIDNIRVRLPHVSSSHTNHPS